MNLIPGQGTKTPHTVGAAKPILQLLWSLCATTREAHAPQGRAQEPCALGQRPRVPQGRSHVPQLRHDAAR